MGATSSTRAALVLLVITSGARADGVRTGPPAASLNPSKAARLASPSGTGAAATAPEAGVEDEVLRAFRLIEGLELVPKSDGSFLYTGRGFNARIDANGGLTITDRFSRASVVLDPQPLDEHNWVVWFFRVTTGLLDRLDKAFGNDPFRSERREFLEKTRDLRMAVLERNTVQALERALHAIWSAASRSPKQKRQAIFSLWAQCSADAYGARARRRIEQYVRERCPRGSACEYPPGELRALNAGRAAEHSFAPYATEPNKP